MKDWRLSVSMDKYKAFRKMYNDAGVSMYAFKLADDEHVDQEYDYIWNVAATLGANHITMELPTDDALLQTGRRVRGEAQAADRVPYSRAGRRVWFSEGACRVALHRHQSRRWAFYGVNGTISRARHGEVSRPDREPATLRIAKAPRAQTITKGPGGGGANMPWGQGETPLKEGSAIDEKHKYKFPASIEYEYNTPEAPMC